MGTFSSVPRILAATVLAAGAISTVAAQEVRDTIGPLEQSAKPSSPENPIPRRTMSAQAVLPPEWRQPAGRGLVRFQVTLNTSGRVGEIRRLGEPLVQFGAATTVDDTTRRTMANAIVDSGAEALRRWAYEAPSAPITFHVVFTFYAAPEPTAVQQDPPPVPVAGRGAPPPLIFPPPLPAPDAGLPPWPPLEGAVQVGRGIPAPRLIKSMQPRYTPEALAAKVQGTVMMQIIVDTDGRVRDARVIRSTVPLLDGAALEAARQLEFTPTAVDGKPARVVMLYETEFNLR